jgi:hypothetical protein
MVTRESIEEQLKDIGFNYKGWGRTEIGELPHIILPDEEIYECANGFYEGGFAMLVATNFRVLLIDKKPLRYLTVEDLRFDMISEIDYSHRLLAAQISISTGTKNLRFISINQERLRKLIGHVQHCMAENKKKQAQHGEDQKLHLEQINRQLQSYLLAQHQQQQKIQEYLANNEGKSIDLNLEPVKPTPELSDYLYAQSLLAEHEKQNEQTQVGQVSRAAADDLYNEGIQEVFGRQNPNQEMPTSQAPPPATQHHGISLEVNPLSVAYSKLPLAMRNKKFGRPSFHAHSGYSQQNPVAPLPQPE